MRPAAGSQSTLFPTTPAAVLRLNGARTADPMEDPA